MASGFGSISHERYVNNPVFYTMRADKEKYHVH